MKPSREFSRSSEAGFSIVEGLVAALILAIVLIGILPMVTRSMQNNLQGNDATYETNAALDHLEKFSSLPFADPQLTITDGSTALTSVDYFLAGDRTWTDTLASTDSPQYTRTMTVEYFSADDLTDGTLDTPLAGTEAPGAYQIKRITIEVTKQRVLGAEPYRLISLKTY